MNDQRHIAMLSALAFGLAACGGLAPPVEELRIPCDRNGQCPSGYYCLESGRCQPKENGDPPRLTLVGVRPEGEGSYDNSLVLPRGERSNFQYKLRNAGGAAAASVGVRFSASDCPAFEFSASVVTARSLPSGVSFEDRETVEPTSACSSPSEVSVVMRTATQRSEATFELRLQ